MTTALQPFIENDSQIADVETAPHNLDAEQAFLGALLYDNELFHRVADWLKPEHFYDPVHGRIFDTASDPYDMVDLKHELPHVAAKLQEALPRRHGFDCTGGEVVV